MLCPRCNNQLPDGARFCNACGASLIQTVQCRNCGNLTEAEYANCKYCGANIQNNQPQQQPQPQAQYQAQYQQPQYQEQYGQQFQPEPQKKGSKKGLIIGLIAGGASLMFIITLVIGALILFGGNSEHALYVKDGELFYSGLKNNDEPFQLSSDLFDNDYFSNQNASDYIDASYALGNNTIISEDGSLIFYPAEINDDGAFSLYYRETDGDSSPAKIDSNVTMYAVNNKATLITYIKDGDDSLYQYSLKDNVKEKIASDVSTFAASDDGSKLLIMSRENSIYFKESGEDKIKVVSEVESVYFMDIEAARLVFTKNGNLYEQTVGEERVTIASDVYRVVGAYDTGEIYYFIGEEQSVSLYDYVYDDMKEHDSLLAEPERPEAPSRWDYDNFEEYEKVYNEYRAALAEYEIAYEEYTEKQARDDLRYSLSDYTITVPSYSLCYYDGEESNVIGTNTAVSYSSFTESRVAPLVIFDTYSYAESDKTNLSQLVGKSIGEFARSVNEQLTGNTDTQIAVAGKVYTLDVGYAVDYTINDACDRVYFIEHTSENNGNLYYIDIESDGSVSEPVLYDTDVTVDYMTFADDDVFIYFKNMSNKRGDFYINSEAIDFNVYMYNMRYNEEPGILAYFTDWDDEKQMGTLKIYDGSEVITIAEDVNSCNLLDDGKVLYLYDYSTTYHKGELYEWDDGDKRKIDDDVICILNPRSSK